MSRRLRDAFGRFATGVTVVTCRADIGPLGITANSFASVSLDPPLVCWMPAKNSRRYDPFVAAEHFAIHVLGHEQAEIGQSFVGEGDAFAGLETTLREGVPLIEGCLARFFCARHEVVDAGDHAIVLGRVEEAEARLGAPLIFSGGAYGTFGA